MHGCLAAVAFAWSHFSQIARQQKPSAVLNLATLLLHAELQKGAGILHAPTSLLGEVLERLVIPAVGQRAAELLERFRGWLALWDRKQSVANVGPLGCGRMSVERRVATFDSLRR